MDEPIRRPPIAGRVEELLARKLKLLAQARDRIAGSVDFPIDGTGILGLDLFPMGEGLLEAHVGGVKPCSDRFCDLVRTLIHLTIEAPLLFGDFGQKDSFFGDTTELLCEADAMEEPDGPFGGIKLPGFDPVPVVMLEGMMKVVIAFPERQEGHEAAVAGGAAVGVRLASDRMAERIDEESHLLDKHDPGDASDQESAQRGWRAAPKVTEQGGQEKTDRDGDGYVVVVLPADERIALEILHVLEGGFGFEFEQEPTDMGVEEPPGDVIGIVVLIDELVVTPMISGPGEDGMFEGGSPEEQGKQANGPGGLKGAVCEESVVTEGNAEACGDKEEEKQADLKRIDSMVPDVDRYERESDEQRADEEKAVAPVNTMPGDAEHSIRMG